MLKTITFYIINRKRLRAAGYRLTRHGLTAEPRHTLADRLRARADLRRRATTVQVSPTAWRSDEGRGPLIELVPRGQGATPSLHS